VRLRTPEGISLTKKHNHGIQYLWRASIEESSPRGIPGGENRYLKLMTIGSFIIIVVGTAFLTSEFIFNAPVSRPEYNLEPYSGSTDGLDLVVVAGSLELSVVRTHIGTMDPHQGPKTMGCSVRVSLENTGSETVADFRAVMGTVFDSKHSVIYSFWVSMRLDGGQVRRISVAPVSVVEVSCYDVGSFKIENQHDYSFGYVRVQFFFCENQTATVTTPLTQIMHAIE
jgi:hypothetical protein